MKQIEPFNTNFHLSERVEQLVKESTKWKITTNKKKVFIAPNIIIAGGVGSFEPRKFPLKEAEKFEKNSVFYSLRYLDSFGQIVSLKFKEASLSEIPTEEFKLIIPEGTDIVSFRDNAQ